MVLLRVQFRINCTALDQSKLSNFVECTINALISATGTECRRNRPLSHGGHFESQENKKLCFCTSGLALDERLAVQNLLFQHCVIKVCRVRPVRSKSRERIQTLRLCVPFEKIYSFLPPREKEHLIAGHFCNNKEKRFCFVTSLSKTQDKR